MLALLRSIYEGLRARWRIRFERVSTTTRDELEVMIDTRRDVPDVHDTLPPRPSIDLEGLPRPREVEPGEE